MVRAPDAPVETAKYMGHGVCDNVTKTVTLPDYTDDRSTIERTVFSIKAALNVTPSELRGIGIQITKLDGSDDNGTGAARPLSNALKKMFDKVAEKNKDKIFKTEPVSEHSNAGKRQPTASRVGRKRSGENCHPGKLTTMMTQTANQLMENNETEELDMNVLAELPDDIRAEILRDYNVKRRMPVKTKKATNQQKPQSNIVDKDFLAALPEEIRAELLRDQNRQNNKTSENGQRKAQSVEVQNTSSNSTEYSISSLNTTADDSGATTVPTVLEDNIFIQTDWRQTLQQWLDTTSEPNEPPLQCDVNAVVESAVELVRSRRINILYLGMRFLHRSVFTYVNLSLQPVNSYRLSGLLMRRDFALGTERIKICMRPFRMKCASGTSHDCT